MGILAFDKFSLLVLQRSHINYKPVADITFQQAIVGFVDLLDIYPLIIGRNVVLGAKVKQLLRFSNSSDG